MRVALLLLISQVAWAGPFKPVKDTRPRIIPSGNAVSDCGRRGISRFGISCVNSKRTFGLFEFAPPEGTGMGSACACTAVTGAKGETMTFTRASVGACTKGNETANIANGDVVFCGSGLPRVMPGGDGSGGLGISMWEARTNSTLRSSEFENAVWATNSLGVAVPTITANQATAPDGTVTADRIQIPATTTAQYSQVYQLTSCPASGQVSASIYVKGNGVSGALDLSSNAPCSYNPTTWTRCVKENFTTSGLIAFGNSSSTTGVADGAQDFFAWGAQCELGSTVSPPIATTSAAASTVVEKLTTGPVAGVDTHGSTAVSLSFASLPAGGIGGDVITFNSSGARPLYLNVSMRVYDGANASTVAAQSVPAQHRYASWWTGVTMQVFNMTDSLSSSIGTFSGNMSATLNTEIGNGGAGAGTPNGVIKAVCLDPSTTVCR